MSILGDGAIQAALDDGIIVVRPMAPWALGTNSIDLHLSKHLALYEGYELRYANPMGLHQELSTADQPIVRRVVMDHKGIVLRPGILYLGSTVEWTYAGPFLPNIDGTSSAGRLGLSIHATAGVGDVGFQGHWTLELSVIEPLRVFGGEPVAQITFATVAGEVKRPYHQKIDASYADAVNDPLPQPSRMWKKKWWHG